MTTKNQDFLQGTLDLLVLRTLRLQPLHGDGIVQRLTPVTRGAFRVNAGSVFPALYRLEREGSLEASWGETENHRRAKYYTLTRAGRRKLAEADARRAARREIVWRRRRLLAHVQIVEREVDAVAGGRQVADERALARLAGARDGDHGHHP